MSLREHLSIIFALYLHGGQKQNVKILLRRLVEEGQVQFYHRDMLPSVQTCCSAFGTVSTVNCQTKILLKIRNQMTATSFISDS